MKGDKVILEDDYTKLMVGPPGGLAQTGAVCVVTIRHSRPWGKTGTTLSLSEEGARALAGELASYLPENRVK
jgi:hypothetical protein